MKTRLYDSELGRFMSKDQAVGGVSALDFNPYLYCGNNPISRIDPSGKSWWSKVTNFVSNTYQVVKSGLTTAYKAVIAFDRKVRNYVNEHIVYPIVRGPVGDFAEWATANPVRLAAVSLGIGIAVGVTLLGGPAAVQAAIAGVRALGTYGAATAGGGAAGGGYTVYQGITNGQRYFGITMDFSRRAAEHLAQRGMDIQKIDGLSGLSKLAARGCEQALIKGAGLDNLANQINSIALTNPIYNSALSLGNQLITINGFKF